MNVLRPIWDVVRTFLLKTFWPWFKKHAWPILRRYILDIFVALLEKQKETLGKYFKQQADNRSNYAEQMARDAEKAANESEDVVEAEKQRAIAHVWRQVAEEFRRENEQLKAKLDELTNATEKDAATAVDLMNIDLALGDGKERIAIDDKQYDLPPLLTDESENEKSLRSTEVEEK